MDYYKLLQDFLCQGGRDIEVLSYNTNGHLIEVNCQDKGEYARTQNIELFDLITFVYNKNNN